MTAEHVAWVVLFVSAFYLLDRLAQFMVAHAIRAYRGKQRNPGRPTSANESTGPEVKDRST
jgi:hypothetical protein